MPAELTIRWLTAEGDCAWRDETGAESGRGSLAQAMAAATGRRVYLVVPGTAVLVTRVAVPASSAGRARAAVPWALEDRLAEEVEALHFALGERHDDGEWSVAVVARRDMDEWLAACARAGVQPAAVIPETLALPQPAADEWIAYVEADRVVVRTGGDSGFACEPAMLEPLAGHMEPPAAIRRLGEDCAHWPAAWADRLRPVEPSADPAAAFSAGRSGIELLQGVYSRRERAGRELRRWRLSAALALALLVVGGVHLGLEYAALGERRAQLQDRMEALFRETFPDVQRVTDPRAQMASRLNTLRAGGGEGPAFADMLARVGRVVSGQGDAAVEGEIRAFTWRSGTLELTVTAADLRTLDAIQRGLSGAGLATELSGVQQGDQQVEGRIRIQEAEQ